MKQSDRALGMDRTITQRDFLDGVSLAIGGAMLAPTLVEARGKQPQANSEAGAVHLTSAAFDHGHRAVDQLNPR